MNYQTNFPHGTLLIHHPLEGLQPSFIRPNDEHYINIINTVGCAGLGESEDDPISPKTPTPHK